MGEQPVDIASFLLVLYEMVGVGVMLWFTGYTNWGKQWRFKEWGL